MSLFGCFGRRTLVPAGLALVILSSSIPSAFADNPLSTTPVDVSGPLQVVLSFPDKNANPQQVDLNSAPQSVVGALPSNLQQLKSSGLLGQPLGSAFGYLWNVTSQDDCGALFTQITNDINSADNAAYGFSACSFGPYASLTADEQTQWQEPVPGCGACEWQTVNGHRVFLDYWIPGNSMVFSVTTPSTCKQSTFICDQDPEFTLEFDIHIRVTLTSNDPNGLVCPLAVDTRQDIQVDDVVGGDQRGAIVSAFENFANSWAIDHITGEEAIVSKSEMLSLGEQLSGIAFASIGNGHLRDEITAHLNLALGPANLGRVAALNGLGDLAQGCADVRQLGFTQFGIAASDQNGLEFILTHPTDTVAGVTDQSTPQNVGGDVNGIPTFAHPQISVQPNQVDVGGQFNVDGGNFTFFDPAHVRIGWTDPSATGLDLAESDIDYGPVGGDITHAVKTRTPGDGQAFFDASNLTPGTTYQFRVRDCDVLSCTDWSGWLNAATQLSGNDQVNLYLDSISQANQIGTATVGPDGTFSALTQLPGGTTTGQHSLIALQPESAQPQPAPRRAPPPKGAIALPTANTGEIARLQPVRNTAVADNANAALLDQTAGSPTTGRNLNVDPNIGAQNVHVAPDVVGRTLDINPSPALLAANPTGPQATTSLTVVGGSQASQASLAAVDPSTNQVLGSVVEATPFVLQGVNFQPGSARIFLDSTSGTDLGAANIAANGTFAQQIALPRGTGNQTHTVLVVEFLNGKTVQTSLTLSVLGIPR